jgi:7,8-dihydropterin-6-yl-methyl-4-(beta-D-ribofuranosyl)aminobenzene 5'-phosphate synthase
MVAERNSRVLRTIPFLIETCHCERSAAIQFRGIPAGGLLGTNHVMRTIQTSGSRFVWLGFVGTALLFCARHTIAGQGATSNPSAGAIEVTVLYDNYALTEGLRTDWGFACMIKGTEKNILFDTGANGPLLLENMDKLQVSAQDASLLVISHDHADHTYGLSSFLGRNSNVLAYLPSAALVQAVQSQGAKAQVSSGPVQICEKVHLTEPMSGAGVFEQSLVLDTNRGLVVLTGCAHPGIVPIITRAKQMLNKEVYLVMGGFHLLDLSDSQVQGVIQQFRQLGVRKVGASHCTGDRAIALFRQAYGEDFVPLGVGRIGIPPVVDFNGDEIVDIKDLVLLVEHWGRNDPSVDIAPPLFGDGVVDEKDLEVLMSYWHKEVLPSSLVAYWRLDETEGQIAHESVDHHDGVLHSGGVWEPMAGMVGGALRLDGSDDYVDTGYALNPSAAAFSVFAWVKGGAPGQVILSQAGGANWLMAAAPDGVLMTDLKSAGRQSKSLSCQTVITDGNWHRVGLSWDGSNRMLYVDDIEVARDTQAGLAGSNGNLTIGTGSATAPGAFWSGLIDDVRVYNRAVKP